MGNKTTVVMNPVWFFYMTIMWVTPSLLVINIPAEMPFWKEETWSYPIYTLVYKLEMQNIGLTKQKRNGHKHHLSQNYRKD